MNVCDALFCLFFSALWLQRDQSILVQEMQLAKDIDLICFKTFPIKAATCSQVGPMSSDCLVDLSRLSLSPEVPNDGQQRDAFPACPRELGESDYSE